jgi:hypothetical protein
MTTNNRVQLGLCAADGLSLSLFSPTRGVGRISSGRLRAAGGDEVETNNSNAALFEILFLFVMTTAAKKAWRPTRRRNNAESKREPDAYNTREDKYIFVGAFR